eukprot:5240367-Pyramimonas_sp.AAC.1
MTNHTCDAGANPRIAHATHHPTDDPSPRSLPAPLPAEVADAPPSGRLVASGQGEHDGFDDDADDGDDDDDDADADEAD